MRRGLPADAAIGRARHISAANQQALVNFSRRFKQSSAALFLCGAGYAVVFGKIRIAQKKNRERAGRRGANWTRGPRRLATSRLVEILCACLSLWFEAGRRGLHSERLFMMARTLATL
jgi:hypothetical protein